MNPIYDFSGQVAAVCPGTFATPMVDDMIDKGELELSVAETDAIGARLRSVF